MKDSYQINWKKIFFSILRMAVGWHFLYEGVSKLVITDWSSYSYLANSTGPISGFYHWLASSTEILKIVDILNIYGLILIGIGLFIGIFRGLLLFQVPFYWFFIILHIPLLDPLYSTLAKATCLLSTRSLLK